MGPLDDQLVAWRNEPDAERTLTLCAAVGQSDQEEVAREVLARAIKLFPTDPDVMLAVGRMLVRLSLLAEAQTPLALAGKADPQDWRPFLELGRLLLLRGDAVRGGQALRRAQVIGCGVEQLDAWLAMAEELAPLQHSAGAEVVAEEVGHRALPWPDDGRAVALGDCTTSQYSPTDPPPREATPLGDEAPRAVLWLSDDSEARRLLRQLTQSAPDGVTDVDEAWFVPRATVATGVWVLGAATVVTLLMLLGALGFGRHVSATRGARATERVEAVEHLQENGRTEAIRQAENEIGRAFDLDPDSPRVAEVWLENRALAALWCPEPALGVSEALTRANSLGLGPSCTAVGYLAQRFAAEDTSGAEELLSSLDGMGETSAIYQLLAGAVLEHRGDPDALRRYRRAAELDPDLVPARVLIALLTLLERGARPGRSAAPTLGTSLDDHPVGRSLTRLQWALDPTRGREPPTAALSPTELEALPRPLRPVPHLVSAVQAMGRKERERAIEQLEAGLALAETPAAVTRFGFEALHAGHLPLARRAAMRVYDIAPEYPRLSVLAARVGLHEGRLNCAAEAIATSRAQRHELATVHAVSAYELSDAQGVAIALRALGEVANSDPELAAFPRFLPVLRGEVSPNADVLQDLGVPTVLWGELVAVDSALDSGKLDLARTMVRVWGARASEQAPYAVRMARLARYSDEPKRAAELALAALRYGDRTPRVLVERVWALLMLGRLRSAELVIEIESPVLGVYGSWLDVLVTKESRNTPEARVLSSRLPLPKSDAPLALWVLVARALVASGETRAQRVLATLLEAHPTHPELLAAQRELGDSQ